MKKVFIVLILLTFVGATFENICDVESYLNTTLQAGLDQHSDEDFDQDGDVESDSDPNSQKLSSMFFVFIPLTFTFEVVIHLVGKSVILFNKTLLSQFNISSLFRPPIS